MSLRFPLMWEVFNLVLIIVKGFTFLHDGAPFEDAWLLLGLCAASVALELVGFGLSCSCPVLVVEGFIYCRRQYVSRY